MVTAIEEILPLGICMELMDLAGELVSLEAEAYANAITFGDYGHDMYRDEQGVKTGIVV